VFTIELTRGPNWHAPVEIVDHRACATDSIEAAVAEAWHWLVETQRTGARRDPLPGCRGAGRALRRTNRRGGLNLAHCPNANTSDAPRTSSEAAMVQGGGFDRGRARVIVSGRYSKWGTLGFGRPIIENPLDLRQAPCRLRRKCRFINVPGPACRPT
jgi:hypothetical protein